MIGRVYWTGGRTVNFDPHKGWGIEGVKNTVIFVCESLSAGAGRAFFLTISGHLLELIGLAKKGIKVTTMTDIILLLHDNSWLSFHPIPPSSTAAQHGLTQSPLPKQWFCRFLEFQDTHTPEWENLSTGILDFEYADQGYTYQLPLFELKDVF